MVLVGSGILCIVVAIRLLGLMKVKQTEVRGEGAMTNRKTTTLLGALALAVFDVVQDAGISMTAGALSA